MRVNGVRGRSAFFHAQSTRHAGTGVSDWPRRKAMAAMSGECGRDALRAARHVVYVRIRLGSVPGLYLHFDRGHASPPRSPNRRRACETAGTTVVAAKPSDATTVAMIVRVLVVSISFASWSELVCKTILAAGGAIEKAP